MKNYHPMFQQRSVSGEAESFALVTHSKGGRVVSQCYRQIKEAELQGRHRVLATNNQFPEVIFED